jgi:hypothetical protein
MRLATCSYEYWPGLGVPVRISKTLPRFVSPDAVLYVESLTPWDIPFEGGRFRERYLQRLTDIGVETIRHDLESLVDSQDTLIVLLCHEPSPLPCHRRIFAAWWEQQTASLLRSFYLKTSTHGVLDLYGNGDDGGLVVPIRRFR